MPDLRAEVAPIGTTTRPAGKVGKKPVARDIDARGGRHWGGARRRGRRVRAPRRRVLEQVPRPAEVVRDRHLIPALADRYRVIALDPGPGVRSRAG